MREGEMGREKGGESGRGEWGKEEDWGRTRGESEGRK